MRVVDLAGNNGEQAQNIATQLNGQIGPLPDGEDKPDNVDPLVILGLAPIQ